MRPAFAPVTWPKLLAAKLPTGAWNWAWLKVLKNSARNSRETLSVMGVALCNAVSKLLMPGPEKNRRLELPGTPSVSSEKTEVLKYWCPAELRGLYLTIP